MRDADLAGKADDARDEDDGQFSGGVFERGTP